MPITLKQTEMSYKDSNGVYHGINTVAENATSNQVTSIQAAGASQVSAIQNKGAETLASIPDEYSALSDNVSDLKSALIDFEAAMKYAGYGVKENGDIVFTSENVNEGDILYYKLIASGTSGVAYIGFFDATDTRLAYYGKGSGSSTVLTYEGTAEIPEGFSYCKVFTTNSLTLDIAYLTIGVPISTKVDVLSNLVDSPFAVDIDTKFKGIIGFQFLSNSNEPNFDPSGNEQYKITNIYYKDSFYLYIAMQRYKDGAWSAFDNVTIALADAPTESGIMILTSNYNRFKVAYVPSLMTSGRATNVNYLVKNTFIAPFITDLQNQINLYTPYDSYMLKDVTRQIVTVKKDGTGDYTTIGAAYSAISSGKLSSFFNQYEIVVYPGTYNEKNLICPRYTHTHGLLPNTVVVTSEDMTGTEPVFDQTGGPSKLSNMEIRSQTGYCIHIDNPLIHAVVNENLHCKKIYSEPMPDFAWVNTSQHRVIIGMGAQPQGMSVVFNDCWFEDGAVVCHSNSSSTENGNFHVVYNNCKLTNAFVQFNMAGNEGAATVGNWVGEINGLAAPKGYAGIVLKYGAAVTGLDYNFGWQIIGGNNDVAIKLDKASDTTAPDCWEQVNVTEKMVVQAKAAITKGQFVTDGWIPATAEEKNHNIIGIALENAASGDDCPVWAGNAFVFSGTNGEYGVGADGTLSASATEKIGKIINNVFYRY